MRPGGDDTQVAQDVLGMRSGPAALAGAAQLVLDQLSIEVEERQPPRLDLPVEDVPDQPPQRGAGDRAAAETRNDVVHVDRETRQREPDVLADDPSHADCKCLLEHDDALRTREGRTQLVDGIRPEALEAEGSYLHALVEIGRA